MADVVALLLNWRGVDETLACLRDLVAVDDVRVHCVVIDNGSGADEVAQIEAAIDALPASAHTVELLALDHNHGFTGGMNRGLQHAERLDAEFALVLNNDMRLPKDFLRPLVDVLRNDVAVAAVGPTIVHPDGSVWAEGGEVAFAPNALRLRNHGGRPSAQTAGPENVGFLPGACVLLRMSVARQAGYFDDAYFMYWEDVALCQRLRELGHRTVWLPWVRVEHLGGHSSGGGRSPLRKFLMACNAVRFLRARGSVRGWLGWWVFDVMLWPVTFVTGPRAALAKMRGTIAGVLAHRASAVDVQRMLG